MLAKMSSRQLSEWMAFERLEPFGFMASLIGHAITSATIANVNRKKNTRAFSIQDFLPKESKKKNGNEFFKDLKAYLFKGKK